MVNAGKSPTSIKLSEDHGPLIGGAALWKSLGFNTQAAFKRAHRLGLLSVHVFEIPNRKGLFALTHEVATWIESVSIKQTEEKNMNEDN